MPRAMSPRAIALQRLVEREIEIYRVYLDAVERERKLVVQSKTNELGAVTEEREKLMQAMAIAQDERFTFMRDALGEPQMLGRQKAPPPSIKLSEFVQQHCAPHEARLLLPRVDVLKTLAGKARGKSRELSEVLSFSLRMIGGLSSIIWSATKHVVRSYTPLGEVKEAVHDQASRKTGVLKEA